VGSHVARGTKRGSELMAGSVRKGRLESKKKKITRKVKSGAKAREGKVISTRGWKKTGK